MRCVPGLLLGWLVVGGCLGTAAWGEEGNAGNTPELPRMETVRIALAVHHDPLYDDLPRAVLDRGAMPLPADAGALNPTIPADGEPHRWILVARFEPPFSACSRVDAISFGWSGEGEDVGVRAAGPCDPNGDILEIPSPGWPASGRGVGVAYLARQEVVDPARTYQPLYWFETAATRPGGIRIAPHEAQGFQVMLRRSLEVHSGLSLPTLGLGHPGTAAPAASLPTGDEPPERDDRGTGSEAPSGLPPMTSAYGNRSTVPVHHGLLSAGEDREPRSALAGAGQEVRVVAYIDSSVAAWRLVKPRFVEVLSNRPLVLAGSGAAPVPELPGETGMAGGTATRVALAFWTLHPGPTPEPGSWNLRLTASDSEDSLDAMFEQSGMEHRVRLR